MSLDIPRNKVTAFIGPSGYGKSTILRSINRMNDLVHGARVSGKVLFRETDSYGEKVDPVEVRRHIGMVFQKPNPFPRSIYENIAWGARINGFTDNLDELVETSLRQAALWNEVKDKLKQNALRLSGGQQQRLCIARAIAGLCEHNFKLLEKIIIEDVAINRLEHEIDDRCTIIIATEQPVAHDLRHLISILKIVTQLERMGDHASSIAKCGIVLGEKINLIPLGKIREMADMIIRMIDGILTAFIDADAGKAAEISAMDDSVDVLRQEIHKEI